LNQHLQKMQQTKVDPIDDKTTFFKHAAFFDAHKVTFFINNLIRKRLRHCIRDQLVGHFDQSEIRYLSATLTGFQMGDENTFKDLT